MTPAKPHGGLSDHLLDWGMELAQGARDAAASGADQWRLQKAADFADLRDDVLGRHGPDGLEAFDRFCGAVPGLTTGAPLAIVESPTIHALLFAAARTAAGALWLGAVASRHDAIDEIRGVVPAQFRPVFDSGVEAAAGADRVAYPRPADIGQADARRIMRYYSKRSGVSSDGGKAEAAPFDVAIERLINLPSIGRATFTVTLAGPDGRCTLEGISGADLLSYNKLRGLALEKLVVLPELAASMRAAWVALLREAMPRAEVIQPDEEETPELAIRAEILRILRGAVPMDEERPSLDLDRGRAVMIEDRICVEPGALVRCLRSVMRDDAPSRQQISEAARSLGLVVYRPRLPDTDNRPRLWAFPARKE